MIKYTKLCDCVSGWNDYKSEGPTGGNGMAEEKKVKVNDRLLNAKMEKKFSIAFASVTIGSIVIAAVAFLNMAMLAKSGGFNLFWPFYRLFGVLLLIILVKYYKLF